MTVTWYVMEDGSFGDPLEVVRDAAGKLRHKDGRAVAYAPHGPRTRSIDPHELGSVNSPKPRGRDMKPEEPPQGEPKRGYRTRESKAE